jgi:hypothetical protein
MNAEALATLRRGDLRPLHVVYPLSGNRSTTMSDAHEILEILRDIPDEHLASRAERGMHRLEARTSLGLYEPDVVIEISHHEAHHQHTIPTLKGIVLRTLKDAFAKDAPSDEAEWPEMPLMASLAVLAACRTSDRDRIRGQATAWAPTPWCDAGVTVVADASGDVRQAVPSQLRAAWSSLVEPTVRITDRTASEATLSIRLHPHQVVVRCDVDAMERIRIESDMASVMADIDGSLAW